MTLPDLPHTGRDTGIKKRTKMKTTGKFQYLKSATSTCPSFIDYAQFMGVVRSGVVRSLVGNARKALAEGDGQRYQEIKRGLPAMMWCGVSRDGTQRAAKYLQPTGYFMIDVDHCSDRAAATRLYEVLSESVGADVEYAGRIAAAHLTPSGEGLRLVVLGTGMCESLGDEMRRFVERFPVIREYGHVDEAVHDYSRLSFLVPEEDFFYINEKMFGMGVETTLANGKYEVPSLPAPEGTEAGRKAEAAEPASYGEIRSTYRYNDALVSEIARRYVERRGEPQVGERHEFYNGMVKNFRNICDNNPQVLHAVLPRFGKPFDETLKQCEFMCKSNTTTGKSKDFYLFLVSEGFVKPRRQAVTEREVKAETERERDDEEAKAVEVPDYLKELGVLPPVFREFVSVCPNEFVFPTITALMPIMGTLTSYLHARYLDNVEHTTTFFSVVYAPPGSGKSFIDRVRRPLFRLLRRRDELNSLREQIFLAENEARAEGEKVPKNPHASIRLFPAINSQTEFLTKMRDNKGFHMFTCAEEVDTFNKGTRAAGGDKSDLFRIAWDNGDYGQSFKGANSFKGTVTLYYNILLTGTLGQVRNYYRNVENGMVTRVCFSEIENQSFADVPVWKLMTKKGRQVVDSFVERCDAKTYLNRIDDIDFEDVQEMDEEAFKKEVPWRSQFRDYTWIDMSWMFPTLKEWLEKERLRAMQDVDYARDTFRRRTAVKGFRLAMICTQCWAECNERQKQIIRNFVTRWMDYDLAQSMKLFGDMFNEKMNEGVQKPTKFKSIFESLPDEFTMADVRVRLQQEGKRTSPTHVISRWRTESLVTNKPEGGMNKLFIKVKSRNNGKKN